MVRRNRLTELVSTIALRVAISFAVASTVWAGWVYYKAAHPARLTCSAVRHDFGQISISDAVQSHEFLLQNTTRRPVEVIAVHVDCSSCMRVDWSSRVVEPGGRVTLKASLLPSTLEEDVEKRIRLYFRGNDQPLVLTLVAQLVKEEALTVVPTSRLPNGCSASEI